MDAEIEAFISDWMQKNTHVLEEIVLLQGDDPTTSYGAAIQNYFNVAPIWSPNPAYRQRDPS
jgi:hypothetical protein